MVERLDRSAAADYVAVSALVEEAGLPKFTAMKSSEVLVGRARAAAEERKSYVEALRSGEAGKLELARAENPARVKRILSEASKESGIRIRSSWEDKSQRVLLWKKVGT